MTRVLHVTESYGGGVAYAIARYIQNTPHVEHHVLAAVRDAADPGDHAVGASLSRLPAHPVRAIAAIRRTVAAVRPDFVHAHSSIAGALCRVSMLNRPARPLVYTPHCYAFERTDVARPVRVFFRTAERVLAVNTGILAACSEREATLSRELGHSTVCLVPNVSGLEPGRKAASGDPAPPVVSAGGRLTAQKDPAFFLEAQQRLAPHLPQVRWRWVGGGDEAWAARLRESGIEVTGWLPPPEYAAKISESAVYLHTARWEGFPLAVLEAVQLGVPVLVRPINAFHAVPEVLHLTDENLTRSLPVRPSAGDAMTDASRMNLGCWREVLSRNTDERQAEALRLLYAPGRSAGGLRRAGRR